MIPYASRTGTRRNIAALKRAGWRMMVSAKGGWQIPKEIEYAIDNGAWWSYQNKQPFDEMAFLRLYEKLGMWADFFVLPDIVAGGARSLDFSLEWLHRLGQPLTLPLLAVQDGMVEDVDKLSELIGPQMGIFLGGTTEWKLGTMPIWGAFARQKNAHFHIGRVNTVRRIKLCAASGADSFDGSSASRYAVTLPKLDNARRQPDLLLERA